MFTVVDESQLPHQGRVGSINWQAVVSAVKQKPNEWLKLDQRVKNSGQAYRLRSHGLEVKVSTIGNADKTFTVFVRYTPEAGE
jgi:hypothetical protein